MAEDKLKVLFVKSADSSFIVNDINLLKKYYSVKIVNCILQRNHVFETFVSLVKLFFGILWADVNYSWFADYHAYVAVRLSRICGKKSLVVIGGYEVANVPDFKYGMMRNEKTARRVRFIIKNATQVLAVSKFSLEEVLQCTNTGKVDLLYNGVDGGLFKPNGQKEKLVITVAYIDQSRIITKGLDTFIGIAKNLPDTSFLIIGDCSDHSVNDLKAAAPDNLKIISVSSKDELIRYYQKAKVYCQLSFRESFGVSLAESMLCECVPVATNAAALPEIVGDTGYYVDYGNVTRATEMVARAIQSDKGKAARARVMNLFSVDQREKILIGKIDQLVNSSAPVEKNITSGFWRDNGR